MSNADWRSLYPFEPKSHVTPGGARLSYLDEGPRSEEAVLCVHGNPSWSFYYRNVVLGLRGHQRVVAVDHVGMGLSDKPQDYPYTLETRIRDLESLVDALGLKRLHLIVHDWGGAIGLGLAGRRPASIGRIVILNTSAFFLESIPWTIALCRLPGFGRLLVRGLNGFAGPATRMTTHARKLTSAERAAYLHPHRNWHDRVAVHQFVRDIPMEPGHGTRAVLDQVEANLALLADKPKLILWGGRDFCFHDGFLERWKRLYPDASVHRYADAGHYVLEDTDGDAVRRACAFLAGRT